MPPKLSRSAAYDWREHRRGRRELADVALGERLQGIPDHTPGTDGWPRVQRALRREGICVGGERVARVMRRRGSSGRYLCKKTRTAVSDEEAKTVDLLERAFGAETVELDRWPPGSRILAG